MPFPLAPTDQLVRDLMAAYVRPLAIGDLAPPFALLDEDGRPTSIMDDHLCGRTLILVFVDDLADETAGAIVGSWRRGAAALDRLDATVMIITASSDMAANRALKNRLGLTFPLFIDANGAAFAAYGLNKRFGFASPARARSVMLTPYRQVRRYWDEPMAADPAQQAEDILVAARVAEETRWIAPFPPVLFVPQALSTEECRALISRFDDVGELTVAKQEAERRNVDYKVPVYDQGRQDRVDHIIRDAAAIALLDRRLFERVIPMIRQAFAFDVTRREDLHIARYVGPRAGVAVGHRDNRTATPHRRFALSLPLNDDYEGGEIVFREFSSRGVRVPAGTAMVFSSSLLHEVLETTKGVRYTLISHFFNDASLQEAHRGTSPSGPSY